MTIKDLLILLAAFFALCFLIVVPGCAPNYSNGSRVGVVTKLSEKGLMFKSWEGEMNMGGMRQSSDSDGHTTIVANVFTFNVDPKIVSEVKAAMDSGQRVELIYRQWAKRPVTIDNSHVVIEVKASK